MTKLVLISVSYSLHMRRCGKAAIHKSACVQNSTELWRFRMKKYAWKEDWKGNDLVACVQMSNYFVAAQMVFWCLVELRPAASLVPASSMVLDRQCLPI